MEPSLVLCVVIGEEGEKGENGVTKKSAVAGRRVLCDFIRMVGIVQWVSRRCLY